MVVTLFGRSAHEFVKHRRRHVEKLIYPAFHELDFERLRVFLVTTWVISLEGIGNRCICESPLSGERRSTGWLRDRHPVTATGTRIHSCDPHSPWRWPLDRRSLVVAQWPDSSIRKSD